MAGKGKFVRIQAVNPESVCNADALLANALLSVGVREHSKFAFRITEREIAGKSYTFWTWLFMPKSEDGQYDTSELVERWSDAAWLKANPSHEWAILRNGLMNMAEVAWRIRETIKRTVVTRGSLEAHIPETASPARRQHLLDKLDGTVPLNAPFTEPSEVQAA